jgi:hypothetical protein
MDKIRIRSCLILLILSETASFYFSQRSNQASISWRISGV